MGKRKRWTPMLGLVGFASAMSACGEDRNTVGLFGDGDSGATTGASGQTEGTASQGSSATDGAVTGDASGTASDTEDEPIFDVGTASDLGLGCVEGDCGCTAVDILFVIDNSGSMAPMQQGLADAFPALADAMWGSLPEGTDLHVGVVRTHFGEMSGSHGESNCEASEPDSEVQAHFFPPDGTGAPDGSQGRLRAAMGQNYFAATVDPNNPGAKQGLSDWFSEAALVGTTSAFEFPAAAAAYAVDPINDPTNAGFLRDEGAVFVIFILTDEVDQSFIVEDPQDLKAMVTDAKTECGGAQCVVTGGLFSPGCLGQGKNNAYEFLKSFGPDPVWDDIGGGFNPDTSHYADVLADTLAPVISKKCEEIPPPQG